MHVIVVGCGRVGSELGLRLAGEHDVVVVDKNQSAFRRLPDGWGGRTLVGFGFDEAKLEEAGVHQAAALAAVTSGDNTNILTARIAREFFEVPNVVARIYDPRRAAIYQRLGIPTVATVSWTVDQVARRLLPDSAVSAWTDPTGGVSMVEHVVPDSFAGRPFSELAHTDRYRPVALTRGGVARLVAAETVAQEGDLVLFAVRSDRVGDLEAVLAVPVTDGTVR